MVPCKLQNFKLPNFPIKCRGFRSTQREYGHYHSAYQTVRCPIIGLQSLNSNGNCSSHSVEWSPCNVPLANRRTVKFNRIDLSKTRLVVNVDRVQKGIWPCQKKIKTYQNNTKNRPYVADCDLQYLINEHDRRSAQSDVREHVRENVLSVSWQIQWDDQFFNHPISIKEVWIKTRF